MGLQRVLRIAALLVLCAGTLEYWVLGQFLPPPFAVAAFLLALSFAVHRWQRPVALVSIGLSILVPVGALLGYLRGELVVAVPIFDTALFAWVLVIALPGARALEDAAAA